MTSRALLLLCLVLAGFSAGCALTPSAQTHTRIQEKPETYNRLTPTQQGDILGGAIQRGNTADMVYLALGKPSKIVTSADGIKAMWVFVEHYASSAAFNMTYNTRDKPYLTGVVGVNAPSHGGEGSQTPMNMGTQNPSPEPDLIAVELKTKTVYVFFFEGKVVEIKLDGDASDQKGGAPNVRTNPAGAGTESALKKT